MTFFLVASILSWLALGYGSAFFPDGVYPALNIKGLLNAFVLFRRLAEIG
jgi:hypothetical protein